jgi:hypothetical protein
LKTASILRGILKIKMSMIPWFKLSQKSDTAARTSLALHDGRLKLYRADIQACSSGLRSGDPGQKFPTIHMRVSYVSSDKLV